MTLTIIDTYLAIDINNALCRLVNKTQPETKYTAIPHILIFVLEYNLIITNNTILH